MVKMDILHPEVLLQDILAIHHQVIIQVVEVVVTVKHYQILVVEEEVFLEVLHPVQEVDLELLF
jgi:hypothetical protein